jgi:predicted membrane-bound spermidine synthase/tetratricopeptide (TPR) repeat protein
MLIAILFFASGFTALVYELLWIRTLTLVFGTSIYAVSIVLTAFFAGLAIGNYYFGRLSDSTGRPLLIYGLLELLIGLYAVFYPLLLDTVSPFYYEAVSSPGWGFATPLIRLLLGLVVLLPPSILIGGTLPLVVKYASRKKRTVGRPLATLYAVNTAGAVVGSLFTGFILAGTFGVRNSMLIAAVINILIAAVVFILFRAGVETAEADKVDKEKVLNREATEKPASGKTGRLWLILSVVCLSGFVSIAYEVAWTRILVHYTGTTTYAFSTILVTFLTGIACGGYVSRWILQTSRNLWFALAVVEAAIGITAIASTAVMDNMGILDLYFQTFLSSHGAGSWQAGLIMTLAKSSIVMFIPALLMGISLPLAVGIVERGWESAGRSVGYIFSMNTLGSIAGSLAAGFFLIPRIGTGWTATSLAAINILLFILLLYSGQPDRKRKRLMLVPGALLLVALVLFSRKDLFRNIYPEDDLLFFAEGPSATVAVVADEDPMNPPYLRMFVDGNGLSGTDYSGRRYMKLLGFLPVILSGGSPENALVICLGTGMTLGAVSLSPSLERLDCAEISGEVVKAAAHFSEDNNNVLNEGRANVIIADGRNYLLVTPHSYDIVTLEPPPPRSAGVVNLYSREFYQYAGDCLSPCGVVCQWIPLHDQSEGDVKVLIRTFIEVFPYVTCWLIERNELALVGSMSPQSIDLEKISRLFEVPGIRNDLVSIDIVDPYDLLSLFLTNEAGLREYVGEGDVVTDDRPIIEFFLFQSGNKTYRYSPYVIESYLPVLEEMREYRSDVRSLLASDEDLDKNSLFDHRIAMRHYVNGTILRNRGQENDARREFMWAVGRIKDNGYFKHYAGISDAQLSRVMNRIREEPEDLALKNRLGYINFMRGNLKDAEPVFRSVIEADPQNVEALVNLGMVHERKGDYEAARRIFSRAVNYSSGEFSSLIKSRLGALEVMDSAMMSDEPSKYHEAALIMWESGRYDEAVDWFSRAIEAAPEWELAYYNLAATFEAMGRYKQALANYVRSYEIEKSEMTANNIDKLRLFLAIERNGSGNVELTNGRRLKVSWKDPHSHNLLGIRYYRNGEYSEAVAAFMRAITEKPDYAEALVNAGKVYEELANYTDALKCYSRSVELDPSLKESVAEKIRALEERGRGQE